MFYSSTSVTARPRRYRPRPVPGTQLPGPQRRTIPNVVGRQTGGSVAIFRDGRFGGYRGAIGNTWFWGPPYTVENIGLETPLLERNRIFWPPNEEFGNSNSITGEWVIIMSIRVLSETPNLVFGCPNSTKSCACAMHHAVKSIRSFCLVRGMFDVLWLTAVKSEMIHIITHKVLYGSGKEDSHRTVRT